MDYKSIPQKEKEKNMKKLNRVLSLVLAICMLAVLFAGCNKMEIEETTPPRNHRTAALR